MKMNTFTKGMILSIIGAALWGISGTFGQFLFIEKNFTPQWLVTIRLLLAGIIMLIFSYKTNKLGIFKIWTSKPDAIHLLIFSIIGMMPVQYTYFLAIKYSNAATATILQYLGPIIIIIYVSIRFKRLPKKNELIAVICAMIGIFVLSTHGDITSLAISPYALFWGLASAFALAFYTLNPVKLLERWDSSIIIGWSMLIGGLFISFIHSPFDFNGTVDIWSMLCLFFVVIFGTLIAFFLYLNSIKYIGATKASLFACVEPLSAAFFSIVWLNVPFELMDWIGFMFILFTVFILSFKPNN
ncbi:MAG: EamA family transporter [Clostridium sp.]